MKAAMLEAQPAEQANEQEAVTKIDYSVLHEFAEWRGVSYNELCATVRNCLTPPAQPAREWVGHDRQHIIDAFAVARDRYKLPTSVAAFQEGALFMERALKSGAYPEATAAAKLREKNAGQPVADDKAGGEPVSAIPDSLRIALEDFDSMEPLGPTTEAVIDAAQKWYLAASRYTHPQPQAEVRVPDGYALKPLTDEQIAAAFEEHDKKYSLVSSRWSFDAGIEFAKHHYGIKEQA